MPEVTAIRVVVSGLVQGVGFRATSCLVARRLGLTGWARNLPDGRVEVLAQGPEEDLARFRAWLREGPSG
ncbi:MAG: acylphosphatase, partial [Acidimicrobiia bacterium]